MTRAPRMPADERRRTLVEATIPLLRDHGTALSTRQIAEAAGVAEGTIFRVFESKEELIGSCLTEALSVEHLRQRLDAARAVDLPTTTRRLVGALSDHLDEVRALMALVHEGHPRHDHAGDHPHAATATADADHDDRCTRPDPRALAQRVVDSLADVLQPHAEELATTPQRAASVLLALTFGAQHPFAGDGALDPDTLAHLALTGLAQEPPRC